MSSDGTATIQQALDFVTSADFSGIPTHRRRYIAEPPPAFVPDGSKDQGLVIGSSIVSFAKGVSNDRRELISNSALFAQLMATKLVPDRKDVEGWYKSYFTTLTNLGWVLQGAGFTRYVASSEQADVHQAVLEIAAGLVGGTATSAYALIKLTLDTLLKAKEKSPWLSLFKRESQRVQAAEFQVSLASPREDGDFLITLMAFTLEASASLEQFFFLKYRTVDATLKHYSGAVSINDDVLRRLNPEVERRIHAFTDGYLSQLPEL